MTKVSIIIPAYNQAEYVGEAIESILAQTYVNWQLIVVDDGSTDATQEVVARYTDTRIRYVYQSNKGVPGTRNTGITASSGDYLAFLDADDTYHPQKLEVQVAQLDQKPDIGLSYASRIEVDSAGNPVWMLRAPARTALKDLVLDFPFTINDLLVRRTWVEKCGPFDESFRLHSEDRDFYLRLALNGCHFSPVDRFVAFRRIHTRRTFSRIPERIETMGRALETAFRHPNCPPEVLALRDLAYAKVYLTWALQEFVQKETRAARDHIQLASRLDPSLFADGGSKFFKSLVWFSVRDGGDHVEPLDLIFAQLPPEIASGSTSFSSAHDWAVARGYLMRGARDIIWDRLEQGDVHFRRAVELGGQLDFAQLQSLADQLSSLASFYGTPRARQALQALSPYLKMVASRDQVRWLSGLFSINQAFDDYSKGEYGRVPGSVMRAIINDPAHIADRGVLTILARSLVGIKRQGA